MKPEDELTAEEVVERSRALYLEGRHRENLPLLESAVERFETDPDIRMLYATVLLASEPERTPGEIEKAIELGPDDPHRQLQAATVMLGLKDYKAARSYLEQAYELAPPDPAFVDELVSLGGNLLAVAGGDQRLAEEALRAVVHDRPEEEMFARELASFLVEKGRRTEALKVIDTALGSVRERDRLLDLRDQLMEERRGRSPFRPGGRRR